MEQSLNMLFFYFLCILFVFFMCIFYLYVYKKPGEQALKKIEKELTNEDITIIMTENNAFTCKITFIGKEHIEKNTALIDKYIDYFIDFTEINTFKKHCYSRNFWNNDRLICVILWK